MSELAEQIGAALDAGGDTGETPAPAAAPAVETETSETQQTETAPEATPEGEQADFLGDEKFDWTKVPAELMPLAKGFQGSFTRRMQEIAEQRKAFEAVDPGALQWAQYVRNLAQTNPAAAAELLKREAEGLAGTVPPAQPDPYEGLQYASQGERFLAERLQQAEQVLQQQEVARARGEIDRRFGEMESKYQTQIPFEERQRICQFCVQNHISDVGLGWQAMNYDRAVQSGRDQAAKIVTQKAGMPGPPAGVANREEPVAREPKSVKEALEMALEEA